MKILMISMFSNHFFNWTEQLRQTEHEVFWIDVFDSDTTVKKIDFVEQITGWRNRFDYPGRYTVKNKLPFLNRIINIFNQKKLESIVDETILRVEPDVVQSFVLFSGAYPIRNVMKKYPKIKWIYSAWGNDLYYMQDIPVELKKIKECLPRFDYMFADCDRDSELAEELGFKGKYLGTFPGGGGYDIKVWDKYVHDFSEKKLILIKGYQGMLGRGIYVIKALKRIKPEIKDYKIVFFGCSLELKEFLKSEGLTTWPNVQMYSNIPHKTVMELMGKSQIYIGNCISDGMPNTLLEAIVMGAFPIQSNPGGATAEIIEHGLNGLLIENPEDSNEIGAHIVEAITNPELMRKGVEYNNKYVRPRLDRDLISKAVIEKYSYVEQQLKRTDC